MQNAELALARAALGALLFGPRTPGVVARVAVDEMPLPLVDASRSEHSIDARPDVRAARERMTASAAGIGAERGMLFRQVGATIGTMQTGRTTSMIAGISVPVPLFDANRGEIQRANAEHDAATFELSTAERSAKADLQGARDAAMILTERTTALTRRDSTTVLARADELRRIALGAYREGAVPLFQVIDAARSWGDARMTYYRTVFAQHQSILTLVVAEGLDLFSAAPAPIARGGASR
jgi:cobalt-zinc-cadmium efflux system outer membrane protein